MNTPHFIIKNISNEDIDKLFLLCDILCVEIFPDFKRDCHIGPSYDDGDYVAVVYNDSGEGVADLYRIGNSADLEDWDDIEHKFHNLDDFTEWALTLMGDFGK